MRHCHKIFLVSLYCVSTLSFGASTLTLSKLQVSTTPIFNMTGAQFCNTVFPEDTTCAPIFNTSTTTLTALLPNPIGGQTITKNNVGGAVSATGLFPTVSVTVVNASGVEIFSGNITNKIGIKCDTTRCETWECHPGECGDSKR